MSNSRLDPLLAHLLHVVPPMTLEALAETELWVEDDMYTILAVPSEKRRALDSLIDSQHVLVTIDDGDEFTLILAEDALSGLPPLLGSGYQVEHRYRWVRLEATLPWDTVGYGAAIFTTLTAAGVSAGFFSGYSIDYLLVSDGDMKVALKSLSNLFAEARRLSSLLA